MEHMTTKEAAKRWGYSEATIRKWCKEGLLMTMSKAEKKNGRWQIPSGAECPKPINKRKVVKV